MTVMRGWEKEKDVKDGRKRGVTIGKELAGAN